MARAGQRRGEQRRDERRAKGSGAGRTDGSRAAQGPGQDGIARGAPRRRGSRPGAGLRHDSADACGDGHARVREDEEPPSLSHRIPGHDALAGEDGEVFAGCSNVGTAVSDAGKVRRGGDSPGSRQSHREYPQLWHVEQLVSNPMGEPQSGQTAALARGPEPSRSLARARARPSASRDRGAASSPAGCAGDGGSGDNDVST